MIRAVLFDIDGTLIDSNDLHVAAWVQAFAEAGHPVEAPAVHRQIGKGGDNLVPTLAPGLSDTEQAALAQGHGRLYKQLFVDRARPFPHAADLLRRTRDEGRRVVLASSASADELDHYVALMGVADLVDARTSIDDVETSKPAPDIFATALEKLGVAPDEALAIGDTPYDIESAGKSGIATVAVLSGGFAADALADAAAVYLDAAELLRRFPDWLR
jgi:HAD superfamily hydrolase (TIGR01509 family)